MISQNTPVNELFMVGPIYASKLKKLGISSVEDLLCHFPFRYEDYSTISKIKNLQEGQYATIIAQINKFENIFTKYGKNIQKAILEDDSGQIEVIWYNQRFLANILKKGLSIAVSGQVKWNKHSFIFEAPDYELIKTNIKMPPHKENEHFSAEKTHLIHTGRLVPVYPETYGVSSKWLRSRIYNLFYKINLPIVDFLPKAILDKYQLMDEKRALYQIHFPSCWQTKEEAVRRLSFDELFTLMYAAVQRKKSQQKLYVKHKLALDPYRKKINQFIKSLPFNLTTSQKKAVQEILSDLSLDTPMNRLLEGDVGSGKTIVATIAMYLAYLNRAQSVLMAPTQILANQHYETISKLLMPLGVKIALITGTVKNLPTQSSSFDIYIGTHALLYKDLSMPKLAFIVIDEQQRFGVRQRAQLREMGLNPHVLITTATPIPRTIALTIYADLQISILDEMPAGRLFVKTWVVPSDKRQAAYVWIKKQISGELTVKKRQQAFIICPYIEESETRESVKAAKNEFKHLAQVYPDLKIGLLHGKLKSNEKNRTLGFFKEGKIDILVSTPVVEVGIDVKGATIMMIEAAERFGLSQLHQLRGRVGRSNIQSYCLLFTNATSKNPLDRLKVMEKVHNGPALAQKDLEIRGAGEIFGTRQHGRLGLKIADITNRPMVEEIKSAIEYIDRVDPALDAFPHLQERMQKYTIEKIAPD